MEPRIYRIGDGNNKCRLRVTLLMVLREGLIFFRRVDSRIRAVICQD